MNVLLRVLGLNLLAHVGSRLPSRAARTTTSIVLIAANLLPLWAVLNGAAGVGDVFVVYWFENVVVWFTSTIKILTARGATAGMPQPTSNVPLAGFFALHFGLFTLVHGFFSFIIAALSGGFTGGPRTWLLLLAAILASHLVSLGLNWFGQGERNVVSPQRAMVVPYPRMLVLHLSVIGGFFLLLGVGRPDSTYDVARRPPVRPEDARRRLLPRSRKAGEPSGPAGHTGAMRTRLLVGGLLLVLAASGCSDGGTETPAESATESPTSTPTATATPPPNPVSLPALMQRDFAGRDLTLRRELASTEAYRQHNVVYRSGKLRISGVLNVPRGQGPHPAVVLAHGYIDPDIYVNGQGMRRELDWLARRGFVTLHVDYRNHAGSDNDPRADTNLRLGYTEDVINAVHALRDWDGPVDDERIGLVGRSMGGGVIYNVLTVAPGLVDAAVVFAPVSSDTVDNFNRWIRRDPGREGIAQRIIRRHGSPEDEPEFWRNASPRSYFDRVTEPIMIHHGTSDDSCPIRWTRRTTEALEEAGADVTLRVYQGEEHAFGPQWPESMRHTTRFLRRHLS